MTSPIFDPQWQADFVAAFCEAAPEPYSYEEDAETPEPWYAPWLWDAEALAEMAAECGFDARRTAERFVKRDFDDIIEVCSNV